MWLGSPEARVEVEICCFTFDHFLTMATLAALDVVQAWLNSLRCPHALDASSDPELIDSLAFLSQRAIGRRCAFLTQFAVLETVLIVGESSEPSRMSGRRFIDCGRHPKLVCPRRRGSCWVWTSSSRRTRYRRSCGSIALARKTR